ncbi:MAG: 3-phosphoglycerate dehydrogenase [Firmicutes bacterium]|nr:3-phosphoglycerate dehydrogenase [Bacillota bacterium]
MNNILVLNNVAKEGIDAFDTNKYTLSKDVKKPDAILVRSMPIHDMEFGPELKIIARCGAGVNNIPIERCTQQGICVVNCPGGNANAVKEMTIAAIIMSMRNGYQAMTWVRNLSDEDSAYGKNVVESGKEKFRGPEIMGKKIAVIGVGNVGSRVAKACHDLGMKVVGYDPYLSHSRYLELGAYLDFAPSFEEAIKDADVVTVHPPLNDETKGMVDAKAVALMKDGVYLANFARGGIVDGDVICDALESGKIAGYATDFPTPRMKKMDKVFCTPHLASGTPEAEINCAIMAARQTIDYLENGNVLNSVNLPDVSFARAEGDRITVIHENKVGMLGLMTEKIAGMGLNIENLVNKAREGIAYTILDFNTQVPQKLADALEAIDGVIRVRIIK